MKLHKTAQNAPFYPLDRSPIQVTLTILLCPIQVVFIRKTTCFSRKNNLFFRFEHSKNKLNITKLQRFYKHFLHVFTRFM